MILNLVASESLGHIWGLLNSLQLVTLGPMYNVSVPENSQSFHSTICSLINFDAVPSDTILGAFFNFTDWQEEDNEDERRLLESSEVTDNQSVPVQELWPLVPDRFDAMGYGGIILINNMGAFFVFIMIALCWIVLFFGTSSILMRIVKQDLSRL